MKKYITFSIREKTRLLPTDRDIHRLLKKTGITNYILEKSVRVIIYDKSSLIFDENIKEEKDLKTALEKIRYTGRLYF